MDNSQEGTNLFIDRELRRVELALGPAKYVYPLNSIPDNLLQNFLRLSDLPTDPEVVLSRFYSPSIPTADVCTVNPMSPFPTNCAPKIMFLTLKDDVLEREIDDIESKVLSLQGRSFKETVPERLELFRDLYLDESKIDPHRFGAVEIFGGKTYRNMLNDPRATLVFQWLDEKIVSRCVQLNCIAEIEPRGSVFYRFIRALRALFTRDYLDLLGRKYACAYKFWICESQVKDLTDPQGFALSE